MVVKTNGTSFLVGEVTTHFRLPIVVGLVDVHWGQTDLGFDPQPYVKVS